MKSTGKRKKYAGLLLKAAGEPIGFTTCLSASAQSLRYRMRSTLDEKKKRIGTWVLFFVMFFSCFCVGKTAFSTDRDTLGNILGQESFELASAYYTEDFDNGEKKEIADKEEKQIFRNRTKTLRYGKRHDLSTQAFF